MAKRSQQIDEAHDLAIAGSFTIPTGPPVDQDHSARSEEWQKRAWQVWHRLGEVRFPTSFLARQSTRLTWDVVSKGEPLDPKASLALIDEATAGIGEDEASRLIVLNLLVAGEGYYIEDETGFKVYSIEQKGLDKKVKAAEAAGLLAPRFYDADPTDTSRPDSSIRTALDPAEELLILTALSRAQSRSRIAQAGMLLTPSQQSFASGDPFGADFEAAMMAGIKDERSPAAMVPIHVTMDGDLIEKVKHIQIKRDYDEKVPGKIDTAIKRIALAMDVPASLILGIADLNHWSAWLETEETYNAHLGPTAAKVADVFAFVIEQKHPELAPVDVLPDPSAILARRSTVRDALDAYTATPPAVSAAYVRDVMGATDDDAPTPEELARLAEVSNTPREPLVAENPGPPVAASLTAPANSLAPMLMGALPMAIEAARSKVGAKLRTKMRGNPDAARLEKVPNAQCASVCAGHLDLIDVDATILEALSPFMAWWEGHDFSLSPREARLAVATHVKETLTSAKCEPDADLLAALGA